MFSVSAGWSSRFEGIKIMATAALAIARHPANDPNQPEGDDERLRYTRKLRARIARNSDAL